MIISRSRSFSAGFLNFSFAMMLAFSLFGTSSYTYPPQRIFTPDPNLVAYWKMEEGNGTSAVDSSGHGHNVKFVNTPANPSWSSDVPSAVSSNTGSLHFDGVDDYAYSFETPEASGTSLLTVEAWVKFDSMSTGVQTIAAASGGTWRSPWWFGTNGGEFGNGNELMVIMQDGNGGLPLATSSGINLQPDQWYHLAFVYDGSQSNNQRIQFYANGLAYSGIPYLTLPTSLFDVHTPIVLGRDQSFTWMNPFKGSMDEVRIYNLARSSSEIAADAVGGIAPTATSPTATPTPVSNPLTIPSVYWKMEEGNGTSVIDASGHGHDIRFVDSPASPLWSIETPFNSSENVGSLHFDGIDDYAYAFEPVETAGSSQLTVEAWVRFDSMSPGMQTIASASGGTWRSPWWFGTSGGEFGNGNELMVIMQDGNGGLPFSTSTGINLQPNTWYHLAFVYDGSEPNARRIQFYADGQVFPSTPYLTLPTNTYNIHAPILIGRDPSFPWMNPFKGVLDEVRIYNTARNSSDLSSDANGQVAPTQNPPTPLPIPTPDLQTYPQAYWKMEEGSGTTVVDSSGYGHTMNFTTNPSNPEWVTDTPSTGSGNIGSLHFDGINDYASSPEIEQTFTSTHITVEAWVKFDSINQGMQTIASASNGIWQSPWWFGTNGGEFGNGAELMVIMQDGNGGLPLVTSIGINLQPNRWYHLAFVYDGSQENHHRIQFYANGRAFPTTPYLTIPTSSFGIHAPILLGWDQSFPWMNPLKGTLDEVRIYNVARTAPDLEVDSAGELAAVDITPTPSVTSTPTATDTPTPSLTPTQTASLTSTPTETGIPSLSNYNAFDAFSALSNPPFGSPWVYGYTWTLGGTFDAYTALRHDIDREQSVLWTRPENFITPNVNKNVSGVDIINVDGCILHPATTYLNLHPGQNNEFTVVRWTAPVDGIYRIDSAFKSLRFCGQATTTDAHVLYNSVSIFDLAINEYMSAGEHAFLSTMSLNAGDTVDFVVGVGQNGNYGADSTGLRADISLLSTSSTLTPTQTPSSTPIVTPSLTPTASPTSTVTPTSTPTEVTVPTVCLYESNGTTGIEGANVEYYSGTWINFGSTGADGCVTSEITPRNYKFRMSYAHASVEKYQDVGVNPIVIFQTVKIDTQLRDSSSNLIDTGNVEYYSGGWYVFGAGNTSGGKVSMELLPRNYKFRMSYAHASVEKYQDVGVDPIVIFQTVKIDTQLRDSNNNLIDTGSVEYYSSGWYVFGAGNTSGGVVSMELLPRNYKFRMSYAHASVEKYQDIDVDPIVVFQTVKIDTQLRDSNNNLIDTGSVEYYSGGWYVFGAGNTSGGKVSMELLPRNYKFRMSHAHASTEKYQDVSLDSNVVFQTSHVTVQLLNSSGIPIDTGSTDYYSGGWHTFGSGNTLNGQVGMELLPGNYKFRIAYANASIEKYQDIGVNLFVLFQTGKVHSNSARATAYYSGAWRTFNQDMELLPKSYKFKFNDGTADTYFNIIGEVINNIH